MSACPACSGNTSRRYEGRGAPRHGAIVRECVACGAVYTTEGSSLYLGESYAIVAPHFTIDPAADSRAKYFDFSTLGSDGPGRRHGWFDPETGLITQVG